MSMHKYLVVFSAALLMAGCSRTAANHVSAQGPSPEPVERSVASQPTAPVTQPTYSQPLSEAAAAPAPPPAAPQYAPTIPAGTALHVRLDESMGTKHERTGERFYATLSQPVSHGGEILLPAGTRFVGHLTESKSSGRLKGRAVLAVRLDAIDWQGRRYAIQTSDIVYATRGHKRHDFRWIAGGGGLGAVIGGIAGGGGGALIGAAAGAGGGAVGAFATGKKQVHLRAETPLTFRLRTPVQL